MNHPAEEKYLSTHAPSADEGLVVVEDFDPANPGQELAEPQKVLRTDMSRHQRKSMQRKNLDKS